MGLNIFPFSVFQDIRVPQAKKELIFRSLILALCFVLAFVVRLFSILRYESVIHEFDPYFNFRTTKYLVNEGFEEFFNWFDDASWYPLGRIIGGTIYPGLMITSAVIYWVLNAFNLTVSIRNVTVLTAPFMSSVTVLSTYFLGKQVRDEKTGLVAAAFVSIVPGYISRSVAGSFDNEGVAIFCLIWTFGTFVKAVRTGSIMWSVIATLAYFSMVSAWGGYVFIINIIPLYVLGLVVTGRFTSRAYVAYSILYTLGTMLSMQIRFVGFQAVQSSEHMAALGVFALIQAYMIIGWIRSLMSEASFQKFWQLAFMFAGGAAAVAIGIGLMTGYISPWTGRFYTLLDPTYAKEHIPIIASVSEHQPTTWSSFFFDLHILVFLIPTGLYFCFKDLTDRNLFIIFYTVSSCYFAGVMVRLMLVLAPAACVMGAIGMSETLSTFSSVIKENAQRKKEKANEKKNAAHVPTELAIVVLAAMMFLLFFFTTHSTWITSEAYSSPSIVLSARSGNGRITFDDFREAYYWLRYNTADDAKVMSWWDYGYQITGMANRTILVDNNTWNNTHIATVGRAMSGTEEVAYKIMRRLDVDYILVLFGGLTGFASDDINKFLWMVRIGGSVDSSVKEADYLSKKGEYRIDADASPRMLNTLMYKMCYYRFGEVMTEYNKPTGWDRVRNVEIGNKNFDLKYIEEAYTTEHWLVRIYKVKKAPTFGADLAPLADSVVAPVKN